MAPSSRRDSWAWLLGNPGSCTNTAPGLPWEGPCVYLVTLSAGLGQQCLCLALKRTKYLREQTLERIRPGSTGCCGQDGKWAYCVQPGGVLG